MRIKGFDKGTNVGKMPGTRLQIELPITRVERLQVIDHVCTVYTVSLFGKKHVFLFGLCRSF